MSEQNEVVIRKVHDGYLVELLDCPLAYTFSSQDEAERFIGPVWQRLDYVKDLHSQALRAENARLREALERIAKPALGGKLQQQIARAALTPQGKGGGTDSSVIVMGPNDAMTEGKGGGE